MSIPLRVWLGCALGLAVLSTAARAVLRPVPPLGEPGLPDPAEVDSLSAFRVPGPAAPRFDDYGAFLPARFPGGPFREILPTPPSPATPGPAVTPTHRLGGIILAGDAPLAFVDGAPVPRGGRLDDGSTLVEISPERVVIRATDGSLHALSLPHD